VAVPTDSAAPARGQRFVEAIGKCTECHGAGFRGKVMIDDPAMGTLAAANLTRGKGGVGADYKTDEDWIRAIRHGVRPDGRALIFMPSQEYYYLSDQDLGDLIAYLKTLAPIDNEVPSPPRVGPVARMLFLAGKFQLVPAELIDHNGPRPADVAPSTDKTYGKYLATVGGCTGCHGAHLEGGQVAPDEPLRPNLTPAGNLGKWTEEQFKTALRTGVRPSGPQMSTAMPWPYTAKMTDDEIHALWSYLQTVPPVPVEKK